MPRASRDPLCAPRRLPSSLRPPGHIPEFGAATRCLGRPLALAPSERTAMSEGFRVEKDSMGEMRVPQSALYGPQTQRAVENFPISGQRFSRRFIQAMGMSKKAAAETNSEMSHVDSAIASAIVEAGDE